jgi:hypothetical protein
MAPLQYVEVESAAPAKDSSGGGGKPAGGGGSGGAGRHAAWLRDPHVRKIAWTGAMILSW